MSPTSNRSEDKATPSQASESGLVTVPDSFIQIIDADHLYVSYLVGKVRKILASHKAYSQLSELRTLLLEIVWRLIRHDFSEEMVMRPAFVAVLGRRGVEMVDEDRSDHESARGALLAMLRELELLEGENETERRKNRLEHFSKAVVATFDQLANHMKVESGRHLPYFESVIPASTSQKLAADYARTFVMTPGLTVPAFGSRGGQNERGVAIFSGGTEEYIRMTRDQLSDIYRGLVGRTAEEIGTRWFDETVARELETMQVHRQPKATHLRPHPQRQRQDLEQIRSATNALGLPIKWPPVVKVKL